MLNLRFVLKAKAYSLTLSISKSIPNLFSNCMFYKTIFLSIIALCSSVSKVLTTAITKILTMTAEIAILAMKELSGISSGMSVRMAVKITLEESGV